MPKAWRLWLAAAFASGLLIVLPAQAADSGSGRLVKAPWLQQQLGMDDLLVLDASPAQLHAARHIPGAVNVDLFSYGPQEVPLTDMQRRVQSWGVSAGTRIVIYDQGGTYLATRLFFDLYHLGVPAEALFVLDGGLAQWQAAGGPVTKDSTPPPQAGTLRITQVNESVRTRLPEFLAATGDPANHAVVEALEASYHFGEAKFFDRAGHVPNAIMLPSADLFNPDKTFKSPEDMQRMMSYLGIRPEQQIHTHCGGGVAASVPFFALKFILNYPQVKLYKESQLEWLQDERGLPFWTYDAPNLRRDMNWLNAWGGRMMRFYGVAQLSVIDVRADYAYRQGHVPYALNIPAETFRRHLAQPEQLAELLGPAGVNPAHEAVIVSDGGITPASALTFLMLERLGQKKVSILTDSVDEWALRGLPITKEPTVVGPRKSPQDVAVPIARYDAVLRTGSLIREPGASQGVYPKVFIAAGRQAPGKRPDGRVIHLPYTALLNTDGTPKAAKDLWQVLDKAGVPRYAEIVCFADDPGEAAATYYVLKLMGYPDVKVWA